MNSRTKREYTDADKLKMLYWVLEDVEADRKAEFSMSTWGFSEKKFGSVAHYSDQRRDKVWETNECGTVACHAGWATLAPYCRKAGIPRDPDEVAPDWFLNERIGREVRSRLFLNTENRGSKHKVIAEQKRILKQIYRQFVGEELRP